MSPSDREGECGPRILAGEAARKRAAVETYARHERALRRTARRYSLCADDAEDALQRGLEILLRKAPSEDPRELIRWTQTVVKHEALAVRRERERILAGPAASDPGSEDWVALIPSESDGPPERAERREAVARSREALRALKPQELRALTLLAEGFSYAEIGEMTGFSRTKVNRCLAEGRDRFRKLISRSEDGSRCEELGPAISAYCDGEAGGEEAAALRDHLRACPRCRSTMRAYRAAPAAAAALAPALPVGRSLLDRAQELAAGLTARFGGGGSADSTLTQLASAGGTRGAGVAALAKAAAICAGAVGGAACVATGFVPATLQLGAGGTGPPAVERSAEPPVAADPGQDEADYEPPATPPAAVEPQPVPKPPDSSPSAAEAEPETSSGAVEYTPPPAPVASPSYPSSGSAAGDPTGEFGP